MTTANVDWPQFVALLGALVLVVWGVLRRRR